MNKTDKQPLISVVITTKNEERNLPDCLAALGSQTIPRDSFEVIVVDNASTDRTREIALAGADLFLEKGPERSAQRNFGIESAHAPVVVYLDADMRLSENVLAECLEAFKDPSVVGLYIPEEVVGSGYWIKVRNFERSFYDATPIDGIRGVRKELFLKLGGFDLSLCGPEDWDLNIRMKELGELKLIASGLKHDEGAFQWGRYLKKKKYYSTSFAAYKEKWPGNEDVKKQFSFWYRYFGVFLENGKWKKLFSHPILAVGMYVLRGAVGFAYIFGRRKIKNQEVY
ncbi:glycosyltransferase [bacterium]|nr:glycosyltransferase [bacterium]